jgi:serine/threonine protein kinase
MLVLAKKLIKALNFFHSKGKIHGSMSSESIYFSSFKSLEDSEFSFPIPNEVETSQEMKDLLEKGFPHDLENAEPKIGRFEHMIEIGNQTIKGISYDDSMISFLAPEIELKKPIDDSMDIWGLGIIIYQLYENINSNNVPKISSIISQDPDFFLPKEKDENSPKYKIERLIHSCLQIDPAERPTCDELLSYLESKESKELKSFPSSSSFFNMKVDDVLKSIKNERGRKFWQDSGWGLKTHIEWMDFLDKYYAYISWKKLSKNQVRGLKKVLCDKGTIFVTFISFDDAISHLGFPFDLNVVSGMEESFRYSFEVTGGSTKDARELYANLIKKTSVFLDPISQVSKGLEENFISLNLTFETEFEKSSPQDALK